MKLGKIVTKVVSLVLTCMITIIMTSVPVMADEAEDKLYLDVQVSNPVGSVMLSKEDEQAIFQSHLGADNSTSEAYFEIDIINSESGIYVNEENSIIRTDFYGDQMGSALGNVYMMSIRGLNFTRNVKGELVIEDELLGLEEYSYYGENYEIDGIGWGGSYGFSFRLEACKYDEFGQELVDSIENYDMPEFDMYVVFYDYLLPEGTTGWTALPVILDGEQNDSVLNFIEEGWNQKENGDWFYVKDGVQQTGWVNDNGIWYHMDNTGIMETGWIQDGGNWYYLNNTGAMRTGWLQDGGNWYYLNSAGAMETGWIQDGDNWYYLNSAGAMETGWIQDGDNWYYLDSAGAMRTGWLQDGGNWYYLNSAGAMQTGWLQDGGEWYYLDDNGAMQSKNGIWTS